MGYLLWTLLLEDTIEDARHHFQGLTFTSLVSFQLPLDYGIVYQFQLLTWIPQKHFENLLLIF